MIMIKFVANLKINYICILNILLIKKKLDLSVGIVKKVSINFR